MSGGSSTPDKTTTTTELPEWARPYSQELLARGANLSQQDMPVYTGQRTAGLNGMQTTGMQMVQNRAQNGSAVVNAGQQNLTDTLNGTYLGSGNPYLGQAIDAASQDVTRNYNSAVNGTDASFARAGAFGGSAWQQAQQGNARELATSLGNLSTQMHMQDYTNERQNQIGAQQTALAYGQVPYQDAQQLMNAGSTQYGYDQQLLTDQMNQFNEQAQSPYKSLDVLANTIRGAVGGGGTVTQSAPGTNPYAQAVGGASALYSLFGS
jgi:hypothetical protein